MSPVYLTPQAVQQMLQTARAAMERTDRRLEVLTDRLETVQWEVADLRSIRATLAWAVEELEKQLVTSPH